MAFDITPPTDLAQAERDIAQVYRRWTEALRIDILRNTLSRETDYLATRAVDDANDHFEFMYDNYHIIRGVDKEEQRRMFVPVIASGTIEAQVTTAKAATIVFWHAVLDATALALCTLIAAHFPEEWDSAGGTRHQDESVESWRERKLRHLAKKPLTKKVRDLLRLARPEDDWISPGHYAYDRARLQRLHQVRRSVVHIEGLKAARDLTDEDFGYLRETGYYLILAVILRFGVKISLLEMYKKQASE